jgi:hypothetical protein
MVQPLQWAGSKSRNSGVNSMRGNSVFYIIGVVVVIVVVLKVLGLF